jgi:hypothetical protein
MNNEREKILGKIRALLAKTAENGCTEFEAMAALEKARAMMDAYEVTAEDVELKGEEAIIMAATGKDPNRVKEFLSMAIAEFCDCKVWRDKQGVLQFCGLRPDTELASWLLDSLSSFTLNELATYLWSHAMLDKSQRRQIIKGFTGGCTSRISKRLRELAAASRTQQTSNGRALVIAKGNLVRAKMSELGLNLQAGRRSRRTVDHSAYAAGQATGDRASFGRPISGHASAALRIGAR